MKAEKKILVVEDYPINRELVKEMLELCHCKVDTAEDGEEAIQMYRNNKYDLILMDIQLPKKDGVEVTKEIRSEEKGDRIPIVALTANSFPGDRERYFAAGMDDLIAKPLKMSELERVLEKYLEKHQK